MKYSPLIGQSLKELESFMISLGQEPYRGKQLFEWLYNWRVDYFREMTNLSNNLRMKLKKYRIHPLKLIETNISQSKKTIKYLFQLQTGRKVESVLMKEGRRRTICLSTQVGCAVDCAFCATAKMGFQQNLSIGEIVDQYMQIRKIYGRPITNVVFMGMGEPFLNYRNSIAAADLLHHPLGINLSSKRITISTVGLVNKIQLYTKEKHPYKLAVSLNGSHGMQRNRIMPITRTNAFSDLIKAIKNYTTNSHKKITIEYVLIKGVNDCRSDAKKLKKILNSINCKLNLIPYNEIESTYERPSNDQIKKFIEALKDAIFPITVRWSKGQGIDAACGQLATVH